MKKFLALLFAGLLTFQSAAFAAWPSSSARTKEWSSSDVLTEPDLEGQFDVIHTYINDFLNSSTGHTHAGTSGQGPKLNIASALTISSQAQGDVIYASSSSAWARLGAGTSGQFLQTQGAAANPQWASPPAAPRASFSNLAVSRTNATTVAVTADDLTLYDTNNNATTINTVSENIAITTSGASGLVSALTEAANTIYYIWIARKSSDGTVNGYLSTTTSYSTFLTQVDTGYNQVALVSCVGNDNSSNFIDFRQKGRNYNFVSAATLASGNVGTGSWTSIDLTPANMSTIAGFVPTNLSDVCFGTFFAQGIVISNKSSGTATPGTNEGNTFGTGQTASNETRSWYFNVPTTDTLYWASSDADATVYLTGFELNKL